MQNESSSDLTDSASNSGTALKLSLPVRESGLFKHTATSYILNFLSDNPDINVSIRQLATVTPLSERATREAVDVLEANDLIETIPAGNARRVHINRDRLVHASDPILNIPQSSFQLPVRLARQYITDELSDVRGIILFGSVARGEADRQSDIDLWVLVGSNHMDQRHTANKLAQRLSDLQIPPTLPVADASMTDFDADWDAIKAALETDTQEWQDAERYSFEILVETSQSIAGQADNIDADRLFGEGITVLSSETLDRVKKEVVTRE